MSAEYELKCNTYAFGDGEKAKRQFLLFLDSVWNLL
jgi:hypothetical protein